MLSGAGEMRKAHWKSLNISESKEKPPFRHLDQKMKKLNDEVMQLRTDFS